MWEGRSGKEFHHLWIVRLSGDTLAIT